LLFQAVSSGQGCLVEILLPPPDGIQSHRFGASVATDGERIICGAVDDGLLGCNDPGHARIFRWTGTVWELEEQLSPSSPSSMPIRFGTSLGISGDRTVIGAPGIGPNSGRAFVFRFDTIDGHWIEEQVLAPADSVIYDEFGACVAFVGDTIIVGAPYATGLGIYTGAVYVFRFDPILGTWIQQQKLIATDGTIYAEFGAAISRDDGVLLVGARDTFVSGSGPGACYVYNYDPGLDEWVFQQKLIASDGASRDGFGSSVSLHGELAVIGAPLDNTTLADVGSCYIFRLDSLLGSWTEEQKLMSPTNGFQQMFGASVGIIGDSILVGVPADDELILDGGAVHAFQYDITQGDWMPAEIITASTGEIWDYFGTSIAMHEEFAVIGVPEDDDEGLDAGGAFTFRRDLVAGNWTEEQRLPAAGGVADDRYGSSVAVSPEFLVVGAPFDDATNLNTGSVYVYRIEAGSIVFEQKLVAGDGLPDDRFGSAVGISDDVIVVGAPYDDEGGQINRGSCYLFRRDPVIGQWIQEQKLVVVDVNGSSRFGTSVDISGDVLISGSPFDSVSVVHDGSAFVFRFDPLSAAWSQEQKILGPSFLAISELGRDVAILGDVAALGSEDQLVIFRRDPALGDWVMDVSFLLPLRSVSLDWGVLVAGTPGGAYVYRLDTGNDWQLDQILVPSDAGFAQLANSSVAVEGQTAIVGAPGGADHPGSVYLFRHDAALEVWTEIRKVECVDASDLDLFGWSVAIQGDVFAVGAPRVDIPCLPIPCSTCDAGGAFLFHASLLCHEFIRGDANGDGSLDIGDPIECLRILFQQASTTCSDSLDLNDDGAIDIGDAVWGLNYLFANGPEIPDPFPACGTDPTPDAILCDGFGCP